MRKSIIRLRPTLSAASKSSARAFRTCGSKAAGELFKSRPKTARSRTRPSGCITQPNRASKASSNLPLRKSRPSELTSFIVEPGPTATNFGAWCAPRRRTSLKDTPAGAMRQAIAVGSFVGKGDAGAGVFRTSDIEQMRMGVLEHLGIAQAPAWLFAAELREGTVIRLLTPYERTVPILAVRPASRRLSTKVRIFIEHLEKTFALCSQFNPPR